MLELTASLLAGLPKNGPTDPIEYYRRPIVGFLFRERINRGLRLLGERRWESALEVGYGAGAVQMVLAPACERLAGLDLDADPEIVSSFLERRGITADLRQGSVYEMPYDDAAFSLVVSFSVFEHLHEYRRALGEVARVLRPGGSFLLGMPAVNKMMDVAFRAIGFKSIEDHHVTTPADVADAFAGAGLRVVRTDALGMPFRPPLGARLYSLWLLERAHSGAALTDR